MFYQKTQKGSASKNSAAKNSAPKNSVFKHSVLLVIILFGFIAFGVANSFPIESEAAPATEINPETVAADPEEEAKAPLPPTHTKPPPESEIWVPIIVYHHIQKVPKYGTSATKSFYIEPEWFEKHLQYLQEHNFTTIHFSDVAEYFETGKPLPLRPVILNFDDGWNNTNDNAIPILKKYDMTATIFAVSNLVGHGARMDWETLKNLHADGFEIGSHSLWHPYLTKSFKAHAEINDSKKKLEEELGEEVTVFAYPFGDYNATTEKIVQDAGYKLGRTFSTGNGISQNNFFHLPVVRVYANIPLSRWDKQLFSEGERPN